MRAIVSGVLYQNELVKAFRSFASIADAWQIEGRPLPILSISHVVTSKTALRRAPLPVAVRRLLQTYYALCPSPFALSFFEVVKQIYFCGEAARLTPDSWLCILMMFSNKLSVSWA